MQHQKKHPVNLLGDERFYYLSSSPHYKNYKYERPKLKNSAFEFMMNMPLDDLPKFIIKKEFQLDPERSKIENIVQQIKRKKSMQELTLREEQLLIRRSISQKAINLQKGEVLLQERLKQQKMLDFDERVRKINEPPATVNLWNSPLQMYQEDRKWHSGKITEHGKPPVLGYAPTPRTQTQQTKKSRQLQRCLQVKQSGSRASTTRHNEPVRGFTPFQLNQMGFPIDSELAKLRATPANDQKRIVFHQN